MASSAASKHALDALTGGQEQGETTLPLPGAVCQPLSAICRARRLPGKRWGVHSDIHSMVLAASR